MNNLWFAIDYGEPIKVYTAYGTATMKKGPCFGETVTVFFPKHGNFNCTCASCSISKTLLPYEQKGYTCIDFEYDDTEEEDKENVEDKEKNTSNLTKNQNMKSEVIQESIKPEKEEQET